MCCQGLARHTTSLTVTLSQKPSYGGIVSGHLYGQCPRPRHFPRQVGESLCSAQVLIGVMFMSLPTCSPPLRTRSRRQQRVSTSWSHVEKVSSRVDKVKQWLLPYG